METIQEKVSFDTNFRPPPRVPRLPLQAQPRLRPLIQPQQGLPPAHPAKIKQLTPLRRLRHTPRQLLFGSRSKTIRGQVEQFRLSVLDVLPPPFHGRLFGHHLFIVLHGFLLDAAVAKGVRCAKGGGRSWKGRGCGEIEENTRYTLVPAFAERFEPKRRGTMRE